MCGIMGYTGTGCATAHLLAGLHALEYRGYDSAGIAVTDPEAGELIAVKAAGRLGQLEEKLKDHSKAAMAACGIGHTRWATHGAPTEQNAHPHTTAHLALVHNGIIENEAALRASLIDAGIRFHSETDTETAARLLDRLYTALGDPAEAILRACEQLRGAFAFAILFRDRPNTIYAICRRSPLIVAHGEDGGTVLASDIPAILPHSRTYIRPPEEVLVILHRDSMTFLDRTGHRLDLSDRAEIVDWSAETAQKGGYRHFMRKEIDEQPEALRKTIAPRVRDGLPYFSLPLLDTDRILTYRTIHMIACGTAMHAALIGRRLIERLARLPVRVEIASEFRYRDPILDPARDLCLFLSQSGETADTLAALHHAKEAGVTTLAIVNTVGSSLAREAAHVLYTFAGPEIAVASTKAYTTQCALLTLLALRLASAHGHMSEESVRTHVAAMTEQLPAAVAAVIAMSDRIAAKAHKLSRAEHLFFLGRGLDADLATEGSLKLKEISYIHSEAYPAGELKHGTISLITEGTPAIVLMTDPALAPKTCSAISEIRARGARVLILTTEEIAAAIGAKSEDCLLLPTTPPLLTPFPAVTALQLLAYHMAAARGCDIDQPRNLAKSVTVE